MTNPIEIIKSQKERGGSYLLLANILEKESGMKNLKKGTLALFVAAAIILGFSMVSFVDDDVVTTTHAPYFYTGAGLLIADWVVSKPMAILINHDIINKGNTP